MIRASAPYTLGWGSFVLLKMDCVRVARGGSLSTLHRLPVDFFSEFYECFQNSLLQPCACTLKVFSATR